jgi:tetratricopeptide (TPR) repeat protein
MVHLMSGEEDQAKAELEEAERLDPESPSIKLLVARYLLAKSDTEGAIAKAKEAVRISDNSPSALMGLAGVYGSTARFDEMRATLDELIAKTNNPAMAEEVKKMFGYEPKTAATGQAAQSDSEAGSSDTEPGSGQFKLKLDSTGGSRASRYGLKSPGDGLDLKLNLGQN